MKLKLSAIEMDTSIQCRATIDTGIVNEYAERMLEIAENGGEKFPPIVVFGTKDKCWPGDGWHRILAAEQLGEDVIDADLRKGGRIDALKYALSANALHGHRRTNADKRRCVELALKEFADKTNRRIAEMIGVTEITIRRYKKRCDIVAPEKVIGRDGKQYPAKRIKKSDIQQEPDLSKLKDIPLFTCPDCGEVFDEEVWHCSECDHHWLMEREECWNCHKGVQDEQKQRKLGPPANGMHYARVAILQLEQIRDDDIEREEAFQCVKRWIEENE
jgi:predicted RNA-binding Zn-ribbon protein involved in translation (DUF1610 family)